MMSEYAFDCPWYDYVFVFRRKIWRAETSMCIGNARYTFDYINLPSCWEFCVREN